METIYNAGRLSNIITNLDRALALDEGDISDGAKTVIANEIIDLQKKRDDYRRQEDPQIEN